MYLQLTLSTTANATERAKEHHPKVKRLSSDSEIFIPCTNDAHPQGHIARYERRADGSLWGECCLRDTGEECPAALGHRVCHHLSEGAQYFLMLESLRAGVDRDGATEHAVTFDGALPQPSRRSSPPIIPRTPLPGETTRVITMLGRTIKDTRVRGIAI